MTAPRRIALFTGADPARLDLIGPAEVFRETNKLRVAQGRPPAYDIVFLHWRECPPSSELWRHLPYRRGRGLDTLLFCSGREAEVAADARVIAWLREAALAARRAGSICTGAFVLAATGLLDGRRATTHWSYTDALRALHPRVRVEDDPIFVKDGPFYSSAGSSAGMDLALALVEEDLGHETALAVARVLVLFLQRPGGQSQFSAQLAAQPAERHPLRELQAWLADHPGDDLSVEAMARRAAMSPRNFARVFRSELGLTPARYVEQVRIDTARRRLQQSADGVDRIAADCGFGTANSMRRAFVRHLGVPPSEYRDRFRAREIA
jgi:transcriptional regulator GlxA family with amidase domain